MTFDSKFLLSTPYSICTLQFILCTFLTFSKYFFKIDTIDGILSCLTDRMKTAVARIAVTSHKGKIPFVGKILRANLMEDFA